MALGPARLRRWLVETSVCLLLVGIAAAALPDRVAREGLPWWATKADAYLFGPDAGEWALQAGAFSAGNLSELDAHRMPTWTLYTALAMRLGNLDVVLAGHLVNKLLLLALGPAVYLLGRAAGMRAGAVVAAVLTITSPQIVGAATRFGVDPTVTTMLPLGMLSAFIAGRYPWFSPLGGAIGGLLAACHLSALAYPLAGLAWCLGAGTGWKRLLSALGYVAGGAACIYGIFQFFPFLPEQFLVDAVAEGIQPTAAPTDGAIAASRDSALALVLSNGPQAFWSTASAIAAAYGPFFVPAIFSAFLPVLGIVGPDVFAPAPNGGRGAWWAAAGRGLLQGLPLAATCAPLLLFTAAELPARYSENVLPMGGLLYYRGASLVVAGMAQFVGRAKSPLSRGLSEFAILGMGFSVQRISPPDENWGEPPPSDARALEVGRALARHFPAGTAAASPLREALPYAAMRYCPNTVCPGGPSDADMEGCVAILRRECAGEGPIPLVVAPGLSVEQEGPFGKQLGAFVGARLAPVETVGDIKIYSLPRTGNIGPNPGDPGPLPR